MRILLIGLGRWGQAHLRAWKQLGAELLVCDAREDLLKKGVEQGAVAGATDYRVLLPQADAVDIVTPAPTHFEIAAHCLEAGKDVLCEKPLALTAESGYELARRAQNRGRLLQVAHVFRFEPAIDVVRDLIAAGRIGRIRYVLSHFMGFRRPRADGGVAVSDGLHFVDLCSYLIGKQPRKVTAILRDYFQRGMDDACWITLDYGFEIAHVEAGYFPPERRRDLHIMGEEGAIVCDLLAPRDKVRVFGHVHQRRGSEWVASEGETIMMDVAEGEPLKRQLAHFLKCCETRSAPLVDGLAGGHAVAILEAAFTSAREERTVPLELMTELKPAV